MKVWIMFNPYEDSVEGVYTDKGKLRKEEELLEDAKKRREKDIAFRKETIERLRTLRKPYIDEATALVGEEEKAKQTDSGGQYKVIRKRRKTLLKQAEKLTADIHKQEDKILSAERMTRAELLYAYGLDRRYFEEYYVED